MSQPIGFVAAPRREQLPSNRNYRFARANPIEKEKLILNRLVAEQAHFTSALDAFAGDGTSTRIFASKAKHILAVEKDRRFLQSAPARCKRCRISYAFADNLTVMPLLSSHSFDLIDLDPYGSCYPQIELAAGLLKGNGVILVSSGDIQRVVRGLSMKNFPGSRKYRGRKAVIWADNVWIPHVLGILHRRAPRLRLLHYFASPVLLRAIFATPGSIKRRAGFSERPRYLGWFEKAIKQETA
jgi:16S rRNA G966 N2-methylase RsmD